MKAKLDRREMMRLGLLTAGGALIAKAGLSSRAFGAAAPTPDRSGRDPEPGPGQPAGPALGGADAAPDGEEAGEPRRHAIWRPDGTTPIDGATKRIHHQYFSITTPLPTAGQPCYSANPANPTYNFAPQKFYELTMAETQIKLHPDYSPTTFWAFDEVVPGPLIKAKYGEPVLVRYKNQLPSVKVPQNYGIAEMTTHLHNGHTPSESDGNPVNYFNSINDPNAVNPNGFKDQHYPERVRRLHRSEIRPGAATRPRLWARCGTTTTISISPPRTSTRACSAATTCSTPWTRAYAAPAWVLPYGEYDIPIFFHDALFDRTCQTVFDLFNLDGILGDRFLANGAIQPFLNVEKWRYRFRLYAPGPSRWWEWSLWDGTNFLPFWQIATDGNLLPNAVQVTSVRIAVAERVDIIVDFSKIKASRLYFVNRAEQINGRGPTGKTLSPGTPVLQVNLTGGATTTTAPIRRSVRSATWA